MQSKNRQNLKFCGTETKAIIEQQIYAKESSYLFLKVILKIKLGIPFLKCFENHPTNRRNFVKLLLL